MTTRIETVSWRGWRSCYRIYNSSVELIVTADVGPRILHYAFLNGSNLLKVVEAETGQTGGDTWRMYGGHRFWHAPEQTPRTYYPDNDPVLVGTHGDVVRFTAPPEVENGVQKVLDIELSPMDSTVTLHHKLQNIGRWRIELAPWALTVMAPGGVAILPLPPRGTHPEALLPVNTLTMWSYTDLSDPRWVFGKKYIMLKQQTGDVLPQKIGASVPNGWLAYVLAGQMFVKHFDYQAGPYADMNSTIEMFTNADMLELETLGHVTWIEPGESVVHRERWTLHANVKSPKGDTDIDQHVLPHIIGQ